MTFSKMLSALSATTGALLAVGTGTAWADVPHPGLYGNKSENNNICKSFSTSVANGGAGGLAGSNQSTGASVAQTASTGGSNTAQIDQANTATLEGTFTGGAGGSAAASNGGVSTKCSNTTVYVLDGRSIDGQEPTRHGTGSRRNSS
ncbi:hypothetical protein SBI_06297 [Streptomyces bingchenggensis BCW-1]|uniref:Secreted protein n=1 Tax=Streptomyces bingchenggensis (strain BCW-1) TaxID=749414 RepID=D7BS99_STRBB|nr:MULTISPECIES: hypothetical protein [Streptomyces]ADI09417.1 hypothetical protein SBI_06297 [Streptomyces bingchenggensis BCW-1]